MISIENANHLLLSMFTVQGTKEENGPTVEVIAYDFVPQFLSLLQKCDIMAKANLLLDMNSPLAPYKSPGNVQGEAHLGQVYQDAYAWLFTDPARRQTVVCAHHSVGG